MSESLTWSLGCNPYGYIPSTVRRIQTPKSPSDLTPITCDFRSVLAAIDCDKLSTTFVPETSVRRNDGAASDLFVVGTPLINCDDTRVTLWLAAGTAGYEYLISTTIMSDDGQELTRSFIIPVAIR